MVMNRLEYKIECKENSKDNILPYYITLYRDNNKILKISYGGNGDLYITYDNFIDDKNDFIITKDNYAIYSLFYKLYENISECKLKAPLTDLEFLNFKRECEVAGLDYHEMVARKEKDIHNYLEYYRHSKVYKSLYRNGVISWISEDVPMDIAPYLTIEMKNEDIVLSFYKPKIKRKLIDDEKIIMGEKNHFSIRIWNHCGRYRPFSKFFMELYNSLCMLPIDYEQIHMEEYILSRKKGDN